MPRHNLFQLPFAFISFCLFSILIVLLLPSPSSAIPPKWRRFASRPRNYALLAIQVHGLDGSSQDFETFSKYLDAQFNRPVIQDYLRNTTDNGFASLFNSEESMPQFKLFSIRSAVNKDFTHDGIETIASRLINEVNEYVNKTVLPELESLDNGLKWRIHVSVIGHSLGGLISRYAIRELLSPVNVLDLIADGERLSFPGSLNYLPIRHPKLIADIVPTSFLTVSSPHLGARDSFNLFFGDGSSSVLLHPILRAVKKSYASMMLGKTGKELMLTDNYTDPLVWRMAKQSGGFRDALRSFRFRTLAQPIRNDFLVSFPSASILLKNLFKTLPRFESSENYDSVINSYSGADFNNSFYQRHFFAPLAEKDESDFGSESGFSSSSSSSSYLTPLSLISGDLVHSMVNASHISEDQITSATNTSQNPPRCSDPDCDVEWVWDDSGQVRIPREAYKDMVSLSWRRLNMDLRLYTGSLFRDSWNILKTHSCAVGFPEGVNADARAACEQSGNLLAYLTVLDFCYILSN